MKRREAQDETYARQLQSEEERTNPNNRHHHPYHSIESPDVRASNMNMSVRGNGPPPNAEPPPSQLTIELTQKSLRGRQGCHSRRRIAVSAAGIHIRT